MLRTPSSNASKADTCSVSLRAQNYLYIKARTDPTFQLHGASASLQVFGNAVLPAGPDNDNDNNDLMCSADEPIPRSASVVAARDGYHPHAMLFVDEGFADAGREARSPTMLGFLWKPVVKFCSGHYRYEWDADTQSPALVQVGIGAEREVAVHAGQSAHFGAPPSSKAATTAASRFAPTS